MKHDRAQWVVVSIAVILLVVSFAKYFPSGLTLIYGDGLSKLNMSRRVFDSLTPGFGQLGGVWLPLQQVLTLPTIWIDPLYRSGLSGSLVSSLAFIGTAVLLYRMVLLITQRVSAAVLAAIFFSANSSMFYMATTPMAEPLLIFTITATVYSLIRLEIEPRSNSRLMWAAGCAFVMSLVRYEGWFVLVATSMAILTIFLKTKMSREELEGRFIAFASLAWVGVLLWLVWETVIFGDPLYFAHTKYSAHAIDVVASGINQSQGNLWATVATYLMAVKVNVALPLLYASVVGFLLYVVQTIRSSKHHISALVLLSVPLFYITSLFLGQTAIGNLDQYGHYYNIRYGLVALPVVAIFAALWVRRRMVVGLILAGFLFVQTASNISQGQMAILNDAGAIPSEGKTEATQWLMANYDSGLVLIEMFKNNDIAFFSRIPLSRFLYEGNQGFWENALKDPQGRVRWVYMSKRPDDLIRQNLSGSQDFKDEFELVFENDYAQIFREREERSSFDASKMPITRNTTYRQRNF